MQEMQDAEYQLDEGLDKNSITAIQLVDLIYGKYLHGMSLGAKLMDMLLKFRGTVSAAVPIWGTNVIAARLRKLKYSTQEIELIRQLAINSMNQAVHKALSDNKLMPKQVDRHADRFGFLALDLDTAEQVKSEIYADARRKLQRSLLDVELVQPRYAPGQEPVQEPVQESNSTDAEPSCWGCGSDWQHQCSAADLIPAAACEFDTTATHMKPDDQVCPDCHAQLSQHTDLRHLTESAHAEIQVGDQVQITGEGPEIFTVDHFSPRGKAWIADTQGQGWYIQPWRLQLVAADDTDDTDDTDDSTDQQLDQLLELAGITVSANPVAAESADDAYVSSDTACQQMNASASNTDATNLDQLNVATNYDSETGNHTVTVSAEGDSAAELMQILHRAGIMQTDQLPVADISEQQHVNSPDAVSYADTDAQLSTGNDLHRPKSQWGARGDNRMTSPALPTVEQLQEQLQHQWQLWRKHNRKSV